MIENPNLGKIIRENRLKQKMTQQDLAKIVSVSVPAVSKWEKGINSPSIDNLLFICSALKINFNDCFSFENESDAEKIRQYNIALAELNKRNNKSDLEQAMERTTFALMHLSFDGRQKVVNYAEDLLSSPQYYKPDIEENEKNIL